MNQPNKESNGRRQFFTGGGREILIVAGLLVLAIYLGSPLAPVLFIVLLGLALIVFLRWAGGKIEFFKGWTGKGISVAVILAAYFITWVNGLEAHERELSAHAADHYAAYKRLNTFLIEKERRPFMTLRAGGPATAMYWSLPILPGILLVESGYYVGTLCAVHSTKIVVYYGFGIASFDLYGSAA